MANKEAPQDMNLMKPVDFWKDSLKIVPAIHAAVTIREGWRSGKMVTEKEYLAAVAKFLAAPADGRGEGARHA